MTLPLSGHRGSTSPTPRSARVRRACITGGGGFIGSNLADRLVADGVEVVIVDDFRTGRREFLATRCRDPGSRLVEGDVLDPRDCSRPRSRAATGCSTSRPTPTCAAASSTRGATSSRTRSPRPTCSRRCATTGSRRSPSPQRARSTASPRCSRRPRTRPFPIQTSLYGASKLAGEGLIAAYAAGFGFTGLIFRFVSILGERYTHGHVFDFFCALQARPAPPARAGRRPPGEVLPLRPGLRRRDPHRGGAPRGRGRAPTSTTWAPTRRSSWTSRWRSITRSIGLAPEIEHTGGGADGRATAR